MNVGYEDEQATTDPASDAASSPGDAEPGDSAANGLGSTVIDSAREWYAGITNSAQDWYSGVARWLNSMSISARMAQLKDSASNATTHIVNLIVVFVLQTILFPLGFLWLFVEIVKSVAARSVAALSGDGSRSARGANSAPR